MNWAGAIVPLAVIAVLAVVILVIFLYVRGRLRNFSQQAFGTSDLSQAVKQIENASESARSIHGMTDIYLPQIHHDFPDFDYDVFKGRVEGVLRGYFAAITSRDVSQLTKDCSASLRNSVSGMIADLNANGYVREIRDTEIHQIEIARYIKNGATVTILFNASVGHYDVTRDEGGADRLRCGVGLCAGRRQNDRLHRQRDRHQLPQLRRAGQKPRTEILRLLRHRHPRDQRPFVELRIRQGGKNGREAVLIL